ncbi:MAG: hypothetical protein OXP69_17560 [Spirochaetaceae bacterium]|nr:hypothetical protein [Spirochaetaceae bacterium]
MSYPTDLPLIRVRRGNVVELTVDQDEYLRQRREQAEQQRIQREQLQVDLWNVRRGERHAPESN